MTPPAPPARTGIVITVFRGGCEVVEEDRVRGLRLVGRTAHQQQSLVVGDRVWFDPEKEIVLDVAERRTWLARLRPLAGRRARRKREEQLLAANMDRLAVVASVVEPAFRPGVIDRFLLAASAGGLDAILLVNKIDLLEGAELPEEVRAFEAAVPVLPVSARTGAGLEPLRERLRDSITVLAGHSGVGKSSLINALEPELRLETGALQRTGRGRHTTSRAVLHRLARNALVVDTPGLRELETGPVDPDLLGVVYPEIAEAALGCRFRDCRHDLEPDCAVRAAVEAGSIPRVRFDSYRRLADEVADA